MHYITSSDRHQISFGSLDEKISSDNPVRFIDHFVNSLDLDRLGYVYPKLKSEGRPPFHPTVLLKLYLYSYQNGLRSSRRIAKECTRNIELQWLLGKLTPNYHSIADFRKTNSQALRNTFKLFIDFLKHAELIGGELIAIDGTKVRASNSKKNNYSPKKIERHLAYIEHKTNEYLAQLEENDQAESKETIQEVAKKIEQLKTHKIRYELLQEQIEQSGETQVSTTDEDARALLVQGQVVEVSYNMQAAVDAKHKLVVATHTINKNDRNALYAISQATQHNLEQEALTVVADKGYHNGGQLRQCREQHIKTIVAHSEVVNSNDKGTTPEYMVTQFKYNKEEDSYTCPQGETLTTKGTWHKKTRERDSYLFKKYRTPKCKTCSVKHLCTGRQKGGREIERSEYAEAVEANNKRYHEHYTIYRKRQEINEHIFGTIKRKWGYHYTDLRGLEKVNGEHSLIMLVYNMTRVRNILTPSKLIELLKTWKPNYKGILVHLQNRLKAKRLERIYFFSREHLLQKIAA